MRNFILLIIIIGFINGCISTQKVMDSWVGSTKQNLIMSWGPPARTASDGANGEILVYAKQIYIPSMTFYNGYGGSTTSPSQTYWDYKMFWVNSDGKIYHWMIQRQQIPPMQIDLNIYRR